MVLEPNKTNSINRGDIILMFIFTKRNNKIEKQFSIKIEKENIP